MVDFLLKHRNKELLGLACLAGFIVLLHWNTISLPLIRDEGEYAYAAWLMRHGSLPYTDAFLQKPPMISYTYWLAQWFDNGSGTAARWLVLLFHFTSALLLGAIARRELGNNAAWLAMWLLCPLLVMPNLDQFAANTEQFMILPLLLLCLLYTKKRGEARVKTWFWAGCTAAVALLYKYSCFPVVFFVFTVWIIESYNRQSKKPYILPRLFAALAGCALCVLFIMSPFIVNDGGQAWYECTIRFNRLYAAAHQFQINAFFSVIKSFVSAWWFLLLMTLIFFFSLPKRWWFYLGLIASALVSTSGSWYGHYYLPLMPFWAFAATGGIMVINNQMTGFMKVNYSWMRVFLLALALIMALLPNFKMLMMSPSKIEHIKYQQYPFCESIAVAEKIASITRPSDRILVAGSEPQILYYAKRKSSTRFVIFYPLTLPTSTAKSYQQQAIREIEERPPKAIVVVSTSSSWLLNDASPKLIVTYINELLKKYTPIGGYRKTADGGTWTDIVSADTYNNCSLVVFTKN